MYRKSLLSRVAGSPRGKLDRVGNDPITKRQTRCRFGFRIMCPLYFNFSVILILQPSTAENGSEEVSSNGLRLCTNNVNYYKCLKKKLE